MPDLVTLFECGYARRCCGIVAGLGDEIGSELKVNAPPAEAGVRARFHLPRVFHDCHRNSGGLADNGEVEIHSRVLLVNVRSSSTLALYSEDNIECNVRWNTHI